MHKIKTIPVRYFAALLEYVMNNQKQRWYFDRNAVGANNGTSPANAWTHKRFWTVPKDKIQFI